MSRIKVYVAEHCQPCKGVKELLEKGHFLINGAKGEIDLIDIETEEGFEEFQKSKLVDRVPFAVADDKSCKIRIDDEADTIFIDCEQDVEKR